MSNNDYLLNIVIYYDNYLEMYDYLLQIDSLENRNLDILIVINKGKRTDVDKLIKDRPCKDIAIKILDYGQNVGYLNALLCTIDEIDITKYEYIILSNTDIEYPDKAIFKKLLDKNYNSDIGCIAPDIYSLSSNSHSNPHYLNRISKTKLRRLIKILSHPLLARIYIKLANIKASRTKSVKSESCFVYSPHGSYMIMSKEFVKSIKGYRYGVILYSEESCIAELLLDKGFRCYYDSDLEIIHTESVITGKMIQEDRFRMWRESLEYIIQEFY